MKPRHLSIRGAEISQLLHYWKAYFQPLQKFTNKSLAVLTGLHPNTVSSHSAGRQGCSRSSQKAYAKAFNLTLSAFLKGE